MQKKYRRLLSCFVILLCVLVSSFSMGFDSKASGLEFYLDYAEPSTSESEGYFTVLLRNDNTGAYEINTFFWYCVAGANGVESPCYADITISPSSMTFSIGGVSSSTSAYYCLSQWNEFGRCSVVQYSSSSAFAWSFSRWGRTCLAYKYAGNVGKLTNNGVNGDSYPFSAYFDESGTSILLQGIISALLDIRNLDSSILSTVNSILSSVDGVENQLSSLTTYLRGAIGQLDTKLASLLDKADRLIEEQEESNTWLQKIWTSIQRLFKGDNVEDDAKTEEFGNQTTSQSNKINDLNEQNKTEKIDVDKASGDVDANIDAEAIGNYGAVLSVFTGNTHILQYILIVLSVALIAYVLFGKR